MSTVSVSAAAMAPATAASTQPNAIPAPDEIFVTAQKRSQALQDIGLAVEALDARTLRDAGVIDMKGVAALTPTLTIIENDSPSSQSYRIRGIGSDPNIPTFEPDVGLFVDGVFIPRSGFAVEDLIDLERVEILAGPQSTLYGKNVTAGVINVLTRAPSDNFEAFSGVSVSRLEGGRNAGVWRSEAAISGPLTPSVRARLTGVYYTHGATFRNLADGAPAANNMERYALRGMIEVSLAGGATLKLTAARTAMPGSRLNNPDLLYYGIAPLRFDTNLGPLFGVRPCPDNDPGNRVICTASPHRTSTSSDLLSAILTMEVGANTLTSITGWSRFYAYKAQADIDQLQIPVLGFDDWQAGNSLTQEIRLISPTGIGKIDWLAGGYLLSSDFKRGDRGRKPTFTLQAAAPLLGLGQPGDVGFFDSRANSNYGALFGQLTYRASKAFAVVAGMRVQTESKKASINNSYAIAPGTSPGTNLIAGTLLPEFVNGNFELSSTRLNWSLTAEFRPRPHTLAYLTYARGSKAGGFNVGFGPSPAADRLFNDETVDNYEAGAKWSSSDNRSKLRIAAFHTRYDQFQNAGFVTFQFLVNNADKVTTTGVEVNGEYLLSPEIRLSLAGVYTDAKYDRYVDGACYPGLQPNNPTKTGCDLSGQSLPFVAHWRAIAGVAYERNVSFGRIFLRGDVRWSSSYATNTNLDPRHSQSDFAIMDLRFGVRARRGWEASAWVKNLGNQDYVIQDVVGSLFGRDPAYQSYLGKPREIGVTLMKNF